MSLLYCRKFFSDGRVGPHINAIVATDDTYNSNRRAIPSVIDTAAARRLD